MPHNIPGSCTHEWLKVLSLSPARSTPYSSAWFHLPIPTTLGASKSLWVSLGREPLCAHYSGMELSVCSH